MRALIIEDEIMAQKQLTRLLENNFPDIVVEAAVGSVSAALDWFSANPSPDVVFMDVELSDGTSFEIFRNITISCPVIMTTAYDSYAIKAFEVGSLDYLLKPIDVDALKRAVGRARDLSRKPDIDRLLSALGSAAPEKKYKERSTVKCGDRIIPVNIDDIAFFFSEDKANYLVMNSGEKYMIESTIDTLEGELDPEKFFRISRGCILSHNAIVSASRNSLTGRLLVTTSPQSPIELTVSRARVDDFLLWLE